VFYIGFVIRREDKDIIKVSNVEDVKVPLKGDIYIVLKTYRGVRKAKRYYYIFEIAILSTEGYLLLITLLNTDLIIGVLDVDFTKVFSASKIVKNL
jgi:hypothetical protein